MSTEREATLNHLLRAIALSEGEFTLLLVRCNSLEVRDRLIEELRLRLEMKLFVWRATPETGVVNLVDCLTESPQGTQVACVVGLEQSPQLNDILAIANNAREEFRRRIPFPVVVWVTDEVEGQLRRQSPDLASWAAPPFGFALEQAELLTILERKTAAVVEQAFHLEGRTGGGQELIGVWKEWQRVEGAFSTALEARIALAEGMEAGSDETAREALERCLALVGSGELAAAAHYRLGLWWEQRGKLNRAEFLDCCDRAEDQLRLAWEMTGRQRTTVGSALGRVLLNLALAEPEVSKRWQAVANIAKRLDELPAFAHGLQAEVALIQQKYVVAYREAERALGENDPENKGLYLLALGQALIGMDQAKDTIPHLGRAKAAVPHVINPDLHIRILESQYWAYTKVENYRKAFKTKCDRIEVEVQYGFRAFLGAGRLKPQRRVGAMGGAVTEEIAASGRQTDIDALVRRVRRNDCRLTVIHGPSGVGKSSLIQSGLVPALRKVIHQSRAVTPILIEHYENWQTELVQKLQKKHQKVYTSQNSLELGNLESKHNTIVNSPSHLPLLHENDRCNLITVLIFDQFEEFFFKHPDSPSRQPFYDFLRDCLNVPYVWIFLSLREDYVHYLLECDRLADLKLINNDILNKNIRYYLGNFSREQAKTVIHELTARSPYRFEDDLIDRLVEDLAADLGEIRPIEMQVVGAQMAQRDTKIVTLEAYVALGENPKQVLVERWLSQIVKDCGPENGELAQRLLFALTEESDKRPIKTKTELQREVRLLTPELLFEEQEVAVKGDLYFVLDIFVKSGLVFEIQSISEAISYQIIHDYLVSLIRKQYGGQLAKLLEKERQKRKLAEQELDQFTQKIAQQKLDNTKKVNFQLKRAQKTFILLSISMTIICIIATWQKGVNDENSLNYNAIRDSYIWKERINYNPYDIDTQISIIEMAKEWHGKCNCSGGSSIYREERGNRSSCSSSPTSFSQKIQYRAILRT